MLTPQGRATSGSGDVPIGMPTVHAPDPLVLEGIGKSFFGVRVLKEITFEAHSGRCLGIVGENGAGKSTLMNILAGSLQPDEGRMHWHGGVYAPTNPRRAEAAGIGFVHQELNLFANLTVAENLLLSRFPRTGPFIRRAAARRKAASLLQRVGLDVSPDTLVENLSAGERQLVEIARALGLEARVLILDEPTTSLSTRETARLFALIRQLRNDGITVLYISHALGDVLDLCDDLLVLRDGALVSKGPAAAYTVPQLITLMVGRQLTQLHPVRKGRPGNTVVLEAQGLNQPGVLRKVSLQLHAGEVLGIFGLLGAGRTELARVLFGLDPCREGTVTLDGQRMRSAPRERVRRGMAFLTEDRRADGLCLEAGVADNIALVSLPHRVRTPLRLLNSRDVRAAVRSIRESVRLQSHLRDEQPVRTLSGGNQQKVVLARWLLAQPRVLILDEPTRGIDVGAKHDIYELIHDTADAGAAALVISSELEELIGICDRILVMSRGRITGEFARGHFDQEKLLAAALAEIR